MEENSLHVPCERLIIPSSHFVRFERFLFLIQFLQKCLLLHVLPPSDGMNYYHLTFVHLIG